MAHNLYESNHGTAMMYVGAPPWHELGQRLSAPPTAAEAIHAARLGWTVSKQPIYVDTRTGCRPVPGRFALMPTDRLSNPDCPVFGVVTSDYVPLQNADAFAFFDPVVASGRATYETAGALGDGERIWVLARMQGDMQVAGSDSVARYLLLSNSHDGKSSIQVKFTPIRVVCQNTLSIALNEGRGYRVQHTHGMPLRLRNVQMTLGLVENRFAEIEAAFQMMARVGLDGARLQSYLAEVFPEPEAPAMPETAAGRQAREPSLGFDQPAGRGRPNPAEALEQERQRVRLLRDRATFLFENGRGNREPRVRGTLWAAYNGVVEMLDYHTAHRSTESLLRSAWFGDRYLTKTRALRIATSRAREWEGNRHQ